MNCYLLTIALIALIKTTIVGAYEVHQLTDSRYNDVIISTKDCSRIYYCSTYNSSNDCFSYCYGLDSKSNDDYVNICHSRDYVNPFKNNKCVKTGKTYLNYYNSNCYTTPYSSKVVTRAGGRVGNGLKQIVNGRCLVGSGWCPCTTSRISSEKCGRVNNTIYECKSGYCCSKWGFCGTSQKHCGYGCQSEFGKCW